MAETEGRTEELSKSSLDMGKVPMSNAAILRCVDTSVLRGPTGKEIKLGVAEVTIGRGSENSVRVDGIGMSRVHARIYFADDGWHAEDLGSTNGTRVNNSAISNARLNDGDTVAFGRVCYKFVKLDARPSISRTLDLGIDQTLILTPAELPGGGPGGQAALDAAAAAARRRRAASHHGTGRHRNVAPRGEAGTGLGTWALVVLVGLVVVVGAVALL